MNRGSSYRSHRLPSEWASPRQKLRWGDQIRAMLDKNPKLTTEDLVRATSAPNAWVRGVRQRWATRRAASP